MNQWRLVLSHQLQWSNVNNAGRVRLQLAGDKLDYFIVKSVEELAHFSSILRNAQPVFYRINDKQLLTGLEQDPDQ